MASNNKGKIVIISSPSGGGKTSICRKLLSRGRKQDGWRFSVSYTTRNPRVGERNGREYHFVSSEEFDRLTANGEFVEYFQVHLYKYGTPRKPLEQVLKDGGVMLLDVDVKGAAKIRREFPEAISIFILPPSIEALRQRLTLRGTETQEQLNVRFENAVEEMQRGVKQTKNGFEYVVVNEDLGKAVQQVLDIIGAHDCRIENLDQEQLKRITG